MAAGGGAHPPPKESPPSEGVTAALDAKSAAGVDHAKFVLWIAVASICLLLAYLLTMDLVVAYNVGHSYDQVLNATRVGSELVTLDHLKRLEDSLADERDYPSKNMSADDSQNAKAVVAMLVQLPSLTSAQHSQLDSCTSSLPATDNSRTEKLAGCLEILSTLKQAALEAASGSANAKLAGDSADKINEQRQAFHTFWIQAAQLILLNLLLPLLTALLGYVFGTQQSR